MPHKYTSPVYPFPTKPFAIVEFLADQKILGTNISGSDLVRKANEYLPDEKLKIKIEKRRRDSSDETEFFSGGYLQVAAINTALDELGIKKIRTVRPEEAMALLRYEDFDNFYQYYVAIGCVIFSEGSEDPKIAAHLIRQLIDLEKIASSEDLPLFVSGLRLRVDSTFDYNLRLDYVEGKSSFNYAPIFEGGKQEFFEANKNQTFQELVSSEKPGRDINIIRHHQGIHPITISSEENAFGIYGDSLYYNDDGRILMSRDPSLSLSRILSFLGSWLQKEKS